MSEKGELVLAYHIDVMLLGTEADNFAKLLQHPDYIVSQSSESLNSSYLEQLKNLLKAPAKIQTKSMSGFQTLRLGNMTQITKSLLTKSLWLTIHFHYPNYQFYDIFLSDFIKGNCAIAVVIDKYDYHASYNRYIIKKMNTNQSKNLRFDNKEIQNNSKNYHYFESHVLAKTHNPILAQFENILSLKIESNKLVYNHMGIKMTVNQVLRWIAERHFESVHQVKMTKAMGDEIETEPRVYYKDSCRLI